MEWKVRIVGSNHDLQELARSLCTGNLTLRPDEHGQYYLACSQFASCNTADEVLEISKNVLGLLNGATKLALGGNLDLAESGVLEERPDGKRIFHMHLSDTIQVHDSISLTVLDSAGNVIEEQKPADPVPIWVGAGLDDETVGKVFRLFGQQHDWVGLYRIFEVIEGDVGSVDKISAQGWSTKSQMRLFKHTANSPMATGDVSRHGKETTEPPKNPMLLSEARALIETLIHHWLRTKVLRSKSILS
ncbi:MAG: hypothetical protein AzoDbin1_04072 [Azoarcus sp.]|nr:hypothetical protein [Azoarcus sp.]